LTEERERLKDQEINGLLPCNQSRDDSEFLFNLEQCGLMKVSFRPTHNSTLVCDPSLPYFPDISPQVYVKEDQNGTNQVTPSTISNKITVSLLSCQRSKEIKRELNLMKSRFSFSVTQQDDFDVIECAFCKLEFSPLQ
jgi:hypothetical protein